MRISDWSSDVCSADLVLHGIQLYGLWSRFACDVAKAFPDRKAVVYGLSNGGVIADHVSVLCHASNISLVFVDDILSDWRTEECRVGQECVSMCRSRLSPFR